MSTPSLIHDDFLLQNAVARRLYRTHARDQAIIDYHCHLPPGEIASDRRYANLTELWLAGDHYKWRAMRTNGIAERYCTGDASPWEKFEQWAATVPRVLRNPLYHWTHLELVRYFDIHERLSPATARSIWERANARLAEADCSCRGLMRRSRVRLVCTTDDPTDSLEHHAAIARDATFDIQVLPTWRPDRALAIETPAAFNAWVDKLAAAAGGDIRTWDDFMGALCRRQDAFHAAGCRLSDHGLETMYAEPYTEAAVKQIFQRARGGAVPTAAEALQFKSALLYELGLMDHAKGWTQQFHLGALRNNNSRLLAQLGPDTGFDSIGDFEIGRPLARFLDRLDRTDQLARTILYNLNPRDNALMATMIGNFQDGSVPGKLQWGSGWWFLDQKDGMEEQLETLSQLGLLSRFVGMLTDSRSFLSYTRHEYFRRILCNLLGNDVAGGLLPDDDALLGGLVRDVCYRNAARYFGFNVPAE